MSCFTERVKQLIIYIHSAKKNKTVFSIKIYKNEKYYQFVKITLRIFVIINKK